MGVFFPKVPGMQIQNPCNMNFHFLVISQIKRKHLTVTSLLGSHAILNLGELTVLSKGIVYVFKKPHVLSHKWGGGHNKPFLSAQYTL